MSTLLVGDIHGCYREWMKLLEKVEFNEHSDTLWLSGDLVARGPDSLAVLREVYKLKSSVRLVLGNHDLHLLAINAGLLEPKTKDKLEQVLSAPDKDELLHWLRMQPLLQHDENKKIILTHAGVTPQWDLSTLINSANEVHETLSSKNYSGFLSKMYGDQPNSWHAELSGSARLRFITNALTRMRFCFPNGELDMECNVSPIDAPSPLKPWFELQSQIDTEYTLFFGHWAALEGRSTKENVIALDTGCVWGGSLSLYHFEEQKFYRQKLK
ncbi:symmetrical bis(5'-nucleosyl)-tetraphosphatase [Thorsellia anophelis]|uniref:Bis(5'-nucleosyl)-tetraphosphatase, symmetrical n=1 Tax=Thorsellia anophelis DSM 18579 TaxID=1123402 RepID=A0A1I0EJX1_9GAMM|nr:symmetrical bis(5'-nucleosyl)-tetraphosphatase [Thorsellia anophelis]SET45657.1 Bis(5'nucleosyl)-tetraphosphatase, ApaH [Thorsellia anophelis DSM 18579]